MFNRETWIEIAHTVTTFSSYRRVIWMSHNHK